MLAAILLHLSHHATPTLRRSWWHGCPRAQPTGSRRRFLLPAAQTISDHNFLDHRLPSSSYRYHGLLPNARGTGLPLWRRLRHAGLSGSLSLSLMLVWRFVARQRSVDAASFTADAHLYHNFRLMASEMVACCALGTGTTRTTVKLFGPRKFIHHPSNSSAGFQWRYLRSTV